MEQNSECNTKCCVYVYGPVLDAMTVKYRAVWLNLSSPSSHQHFGWIFVDLHLNDRIEP